MPTPTSSPATLRPDLAGQFEEFDLEMNRAGYIGMRVFPVIESGLQADNPGKMKLKDLLFSGNTARSSGSGYNRGSFNYDTFSFATKENGWEEPVDERDERRYRHLIEAERIATARAFGVVTRNQEGRIADLLFNTTTWTGGSLTTAIADAKRWSLPVAAEPIVDIENAVQKVYDGTGMWPNALVLNYKAFRLLRNCEQIIERINSEGAGSPSKASDVTTEMLARVFDLENIIVGKASKNPANEGQAATPQQIWPTTMVSVCRVASTADMREACVGRTFHWAEDGSSIGGTIETYEETQTRSTIIRVRHETDEVVMYKEMAHLITNVVA